MRMIRLAGVFSIISLMPVPGAVPEAHAEGASPRETLAARAADRSLPRSQRERAVEELGRLRDPRVIPVLIGLIGEEESDSEIRADAASALARYAGNHGKGGRDLVTPVVSALHRERDGFARSQLGVALRDLGRIRQNRDAVIRSLSAELGDRSSAGRGEAAKVLASLRAHGELDRIVEAIEAAPRGSRGPDESIRSDLIFAAGTLLERHRGGVPGSADRAREVLLARLSSDSSGFVRSLAADALADLRNAGDAGVTPALVRLFSGARTDVKSLIVQTIGETGDVEGLDVVIRAAGIDGGFDLAFRTVNALKRFSGYAAVVSPLINMTRNREQSIRQSAAEGLGAALRSNWDDLPEHQRIAALGALTELLADPEKHVREKAARALGERLAAIGKNDPEVRRVLDRCFPKSAGRGLGNAGTAVTYTLDVFLFFGFPAFTSAVDEDMRRSRIRGPEKPWTREEVRQFRAFIESLLLFNGPLVG